MSKRLTVRKMLTKRLAESKRGLKMQPHYKDLTDVMGGMYDEQLEQQYTQNMQTDIKQIEYLLKCLDNQ